ncbi:MAG TPA: MFS transporter, partial [Opitutus sp.]|nr:MFS transporter [Opitutus sp.]
MSGKELCAYGTGIIAYQFVHSGIAALAMVIFNIELGLAPGLVGAVLMAGRIWDAITNPIVGALSDNTRTRWGRRRPYLLAGAIACGVIYPLVWLAPREASENLLLGYLLLTSLLLYTAFAFYSVPYMA